MQRAPVCGTYRGYRICGMGPSSSGGTTVFETLKQLERFNLTALGPKSPVAWHLIAESMRLAYADREQYLGDPAFVSVPAAGLMDAAYLAKRSALISPDRTMPSVAAGRPAGAPKLCMPAPVAEHGTSHFVAVDSRGQCRFGDLDDREYFRLGADGQRLLSQQRADRLQHSSGQERLPHRQPSPGWKAAAQLDEPDHRLGAERPCPARGRGGGWADHSGASPQGDHRGDRLASSAQQAIALPMILAPGPTPFTSSAEPISKR